MSKKFLIYTDVHWSTYSSILRRRGEKYSTRLHSLINSMNWVEQLAIDLGCDEEICCGDYFDRPDLLAEELTALQEIKWNNLPKKFLVGNHESNINSLEYSSTKALESVNAEIIDNTSKYSVNDNVDFFFVPYILTNGIIKLNDYIDQNSGKKKVVFAHSDIAGLQYGKFTSQTGFDAEDICNNCDLFINGHLHNGQIINKKIVLVGNLCGQNFNENALMYDHLVYVLTVEDSGRLILESYENPYAFNFYKFYINNKDDINQLYNLKQNSVVSISCCDDLIDDVDLALSKNDNIVESRLSVVYTGNQQQDATILQVEDHLKQFIEFVQQKLEPSPALEQELAILGGVAIDENKI